MTDLPTVEQLETLTLRSIVAYAVRSARRASVKLRGIVEADVAETPLRIAENLASMREFDRSGLPAVLFAASAVAKVMTTLETRDLKLAALCLTRTAMSASHVFRAVESLGVPLKAHYHANFAAREAAPCAMDAADALGDVTPAPIDCAHSDYDILLKNFGRHQVVTLGEPVDFSEEWWRREMLALESRS